MKRFLVRSLVLLCVLAMVVPLGFRIAAMLRETQTLAETRPAKGTTIATRMGEIYLETHGPKAGQTLLFAHGTAAWSRLWEPSLIAAAQAGYRATAFDMPPFGFSERDPSGNYSRVTQAKRLLALVAALETRPILVAHSFGAGPATEAVMMKPDAFAGLILVDGALGLGSHETSATLPFYLRPLWLREIILSGTVTNPLMTRTLLKTLIAQKQAATPEIATMLQRPGQIKGSTAALAQWLPSLLLPPTDAQSTHPAAYRALELPVAFIWGDADTITPLDQAIELNTLLPSAQLSILKGIGHIPQLEDPTAFNAALLKLLQSPEFASK